jgi:hypothetical protein
MKYELWQTEYENGNGISYSLFPEDNESTRRLLEPNAKIIWIVETAS